MKKTSINIFALLLAAITIFFSPNTYATGRAIAISPMSQKVILIPGETYQGSFTVANPASSTENLHYLITIGSYFPDSGENSVDDYGDVDLITTTNMNMIMDWITIINPVGTIAPNDSVAVEFLINVPKDAPAGGQYASLLVKENPETEIANNSTTIVEIMQMAHVIYAEVAGNTREEGIILNNNIPSFVLNNTLEATSLVQNNGNIHTDAEYILQVWPLFGNEEICTNEENVDTSMVFPETERYHAQTCQLPAVGIFRAKQVVKIFGETSIVEKTIIVCPIWLLFIIIFAIIMLISYFVVKAKSRKKAAKKSTK